ncbi:shikimate kinase [Marinithermofilum abyssi]|uniref:Shikimate kinase n=1 Tax=Marinithermofilum abyssi TaxID=1571185 RepID=A0A8J2VJC8_9BACL|nr:shikimate kinase [Marinithermofilum abyssi]GGE23072.1 shikimate kinase [Marinithermofilum abyssi]
MPLSKHLILTGFMGTGKTTVGKLLAEKLNCPLVDTDAEVEKSVKQSISSLFAEKGEAVFRDWESRVLKEVLSGPPRVVTTGGGIVLRQENRRMMRSLGWVVCLTADRDELLHRLKGDESRPLLQGNARQKVEQLLEERRGYYRDSDWVIDTTGKTPEEVADEVISAIQKEFSQV